MLPPPLRATAGSGPLSQPTETAQWVSGWGEWAAREEECSGAEHCQGFGWLESGSHLQRAAHTSTEGLGQQLRAWGSSMVSKQAAKGCFSPTPTGPLPSTHSPFLRGRVCHAQPTHSSTPEQISNTDLGDRGLCRVARDYPQESRAQGGAGRA